MATKKKPTPKAQAKPSRAKPPPPPPKKSAAPPKLSTLKPAFGPGVADEALDEPLLDASGVFRAVTQVEAAQRGRDEDETKRFSDPSMVISFEAKGIRDEAADVQPGDSGSFDPESLLDDAQRAARRKRLASLATQKRR
ncbi:MAG: hypothetical protein JWO36_1542 [Myxococcales bacterium]|nr:hypothetical protein [Myxococcales bacterium]